MKLLKFLFRKKQTKPTNKCICELNKEGQNISGWCPKHHEDWL